MNLAEFLPIFAGLLVLAGILSAWRCLSMFGSWHPAAAVVMHGGYDEQRIQRDRWSPWARGRDDTVTIEDEVSFTTLTGVRQRALVRRSVMRGRKPDAVFRIWYKDDDPSKATVKGPFFWALVAAACLAGLVFTFTSGVEMARTGKPPQWLVHFTGGEDS